MAFINYVKGNKSQYNQGTYPDSIFLAVDKQEIIFQGVSYGTSKDLKAVDSISLNGTGYLSIHYHNGESEGFQLTKAMVGLGNVDNTADVDKPVSNAVNQLVNSTKNTIDNYTVNGKKISSNPTLGKADVGLSNVDNTKQVPYSEKGQAGGVVPLNEEGKIDSVYIDGQQSPVKGVDGTYTSSALPGSPTEGMFVWCSDDNKFREWTGSAWDVVDPKQDTLYNFRNNPPSGDTGRINILFRWDGKAMAEVSSTISIGEVTGTAYDGGKGKANRDAISSLPGTLVSNITKGSVNGTSLVINVNVATKSGLNYKSPAAANITFTAATTSVAGLMSSTDKSRLDTLYTQISKTGKFSFLDGTVTPSGTTVVIKNQVINTASGEPTDTPITLPAATTTLAGVMSAADKKKLDGIAEGANKYVLPVATSSALGGIMIGYTENGKNYPVELSSNKAFVTVPWTDTKVTQAAAISTDGSFNVLLGNSNNTNAETAGVNKAGGLTYNPSTKVLSTTTFKGALNGNADTATSATKATQDASGNVITTTYATKSELSNYLPLSGGTMNGNITFESEPVGNVGDAVLYDKQADKLIIVPTTDDIGTKYPSDNYEPIGVVVIPASHDVYGTGECGVMSLKEMSCDSPDSGSTSYEGIYWGKYERDISLPNLDLVPTGNTSNGIPTGSGSYAYLPSDKFSGTQCAHDTDVSYYDSLSEPTPSPYLTDGSRNPGYYQTTSPSSSNNALADFDGIGNSQVLWDSATSQSNWKTASSITNNSTSGYSPAACCCWRYHTEGTSQGDWYLPAMGELGYIMPPFNRINDAIDKMRTAYGSSVGVELLSTNGAYCSSTEYDMWNARSVGLTKGSADYYNKNTNFHVRAWLRVLPTSNSSKGIIISGKSKTDLLNAAGGTTTIDSIREGLATEDVLNEYKTSNDAEIAALKSKDTELSNKIDSIHIPSKVSELENDSKYQTEDQVNSRIQAVVGAAPETLDTLNELAAALGDDPNFATTVTNQIAQKADKTTATTSTDGLMSAADKVQLGNVVTFVGNNNYDGTNYLTKETNLTEAVLQLDEEIKATNDNLALEHTNAEATYAKKTELGKKLDISTYTSDKATFALKSDIPNVSNFLTISNAQSTYLTKTDASNTYQPKGSYLTSVSIATISDLNANWDALLKSDPSGYVTRWPNMSEVGSKQNLVIKLNGGTTEGTNQFTYNVTAAKSINITPSSIGAAASSHNHNASQVSGLSKVATSGSYNDLTNKPSIPSAYTLPKATTSTLGGIKVGDGLEITGDGTLNCIIDPGSGTVSWGNIQGKPSVFATNIASINDLNSGWDAILKAAPNIPSLNGYATQSWVTSQGFITSIPSEYVTDTELNAKGFLTKATADGYYQPKGNYLTSVSWSQISGKPEFAAVATSGSYNDLTNKPTIPSLTGYATQNWVNSQGFAKGSFLPLTGGTISGNLIISNAGDDKNVHINANTGITLKGTGVGISLSTGGSSSKFFATDGSVQTINVADFALKSTTDTLTNITNSQDQRISNMKLGMARYISGSTATVINGDEGMVGLSGTPALYFYNGGISTDNVPIRNCIRIQGGQCYVDNNGIFITLASISTSEIDELFN